MSKYNDGKTPMVTSISDIRAFKNCRTQWHFSSELRESRRPARSPLYFTFGRAFHEAMDTFYSNYEAPSSLREHLALEAFDSYIIEEAQEEGIPLDDEKLNEILEFGPELIKEYSIWVQRETEYNKSELGFEFEVISTEEPHTLHLFDNLYYGFRTDLIIRRIDNNTLWLVDFKTASVMPTENALEYLDTDEQATSYLYASEQVCQCDITGIIFVFACTKRFQPPRILNSGLLSKNQNQYTTARLYKEAISRLNLFFDDYSNIINILEDKEFFKVVQVVRSRSEKDYFWDNNLIPVVREMSNNPLIYPNASRISCSMCSYKGPCIASNNPRLDPYSELHAFYVKSEPRYLVKPEEV